MDKVTLTFIFLFVVSKAMASIPVRQAGTEKLNHYVDSGVFVGGHDHGPMRLLNVRHNLTGKFERLVFDVGQNSNESGVERPGFFHVSVQSKPNRVVLDLENVTDSNVTAEQIVRLFQKSPYFSKVSIYPDSLHKNLTIELPLKVAAQVEVFELVTPKKPGRIVMDVKAL